MDVYDYTVDGYVTDAMVAKAQADWEANLIPLALVVAVINAWENHTLITDPAAKKAVLLGAVVAAGVVGLFFLFKKR
jgi:hypothetical protein